MISDIRVMNRLMLAVASPLLDDAVTGARCNEKGDDENHEARNDKLYHLLDRKQVKKRILERRLRRRGGAIS